LGQDSESQQKSGDEHDNRNEVQIAFCHVEMFVFQGFRKGLLLHDGSETLVHLILGFKEEYSPPNDGDSC
jgi:hypothetical protein